MPFLNEPDRTRPDNSYPPNDPMIPDRVKSSASSAWKLIKSAFVPILFGISASCLMYLLVQYGFNEGRDQNMLCVQVEDGFDCMAVDWDVVLQLLEESDG